MKLSPIDAPCRALDLRFPHTAEHVISPLLCYDQTVTTNRDCQPAASRC